jgi:signal transduction histidine kinase
MHIFGIFAFGFTFVLGIVGLVHHKHDVVKYLPYGVLVFVINVIYLKIIILSRKDYEKRLKKKKEYTQKLLKFQKLFLRYTIHETNTPLAVIMANIELYELEHGKSETLSNIEAATKNIYSIYDDLSYLTKKEQISYPKQIICLVEFVKARLDFFNIVAHQSELSFNLHDNYSFASIFINETKLQRIIDNNITNAIKYTKELEHIHIIISQIEDSVIFEISSHSSIIQEPNRVFEPYYREQSSKEGLGLGLNLVKEICDEEGIDIIIKSTKELTSFQYFFKKANYENFTS